MITTTNGTPETGTLETTKPRITLREALLIVDAALRIVVDAEAAEAAEQALPRPTPAEIARANVLTHCEDLIDGIYSYVKAAGMSETGRLLWDAGGELRGEMLSDRLQPRTGFGHLLTLDALLNAPEALQHAVRAMRKALIDVSPELETFR